MGYYNYGYSSAAGGIGFVTFLMVAIPVALAVAAFIYFLKPGAEKRGTKLGQYLNFDHLYIHEVLKVLHMIAFVGMCVLVVATLLMALAALFMGGGFAGFIGILGVAVLEVVGVAILRLGFERSIIAVRQAEDVRAMREKIAPLPQQPEEPVQPKAPVYGATPAPTPTAGPAPVATSAPEPAPTAAPTPASAPAPTSTPAAPDTWVCPQCGATNAGKFCGKCGHARP